MHKDVRAGLALAGGLLWTALAGAQPAAGSIQAKFAGRMLLVDFPQAMQTWANEVPAATVRITPSLVPAPCHWDSDTRLACALATDTAAATRYRIDVAPGLKTQRGDMLGAQVLFVETARPSLSAQVAEWESGRPHLVVDAPRQVDIASIRTVLRMTLNGAPIPLPPLRPLPSRWNGDDARFELTLPKARSTILAADGRALRLDIVPGLRTTAGPLRGVQHATLLKVRIDEPFRLRKVTCAGRSGPLVAQPTATADLECVPGEPIRLMFSRPLDAASRRRFAQSLPPAVELREWSREDAWADRGSELDDGIQAVRSRWVDLRIAAPRASSRLELGDDLRAEDGSRLLPASLELHTDDALPRVEAPHEHTLLVGGKRPPALMETVNAPQVTFDVSGLGERSHQETLRTVEHRDNTARPVESAASSAALAEGGWVRWTPATQVPEAERSRWSEPDSVEFAAPGFDLYAVTGRREVLAWANAWDHDAPVAGADVELLWRETAQATPRVVAHGRTDADGVALLRLPDTLTLPTRDPRSDKASTAMWLLRAAAGRGHAAARAVLPVATDRWGTSLGEAPVRRTWGVTDRPMYRAGDRIHYRLWQRDLDGIHPRAPRTSDPVTLVLRDENHEKTILHWQATPDGHGNLAGEATLPIHLVDATYCIGIQDVQYQDVEGACFFVGTYRAQDLWAEVHSGSKVLRDGDHFIADLSAGYYSGGPAVGVGVDRIDVVLDPLPVEEAYPQFAQYRFVDVRGDGVESPDFSGVPGTAKLDPVGKWHLDLPVAFKGSATEIAKRPAFGTITIGAQVSPDDREGTAAYENATHYARYARYVGLRTDPTWFDARTPIQAEAVVIDAQGHAIDDVAVDVDVEFLPFFDDHRSKPVHVGHCTLRSHAPAPCNFPRLKSGRYRLIASSGDAAHASLERYVWTDEPTETNAENAELTVLDPSPQRDTPVRALLKQPYPHARALVVVAAGDRIVDYRVETIDGGAKGLELPVSPDWKADLELMVHVRDARPQPSKANYRVATKMVSASAQLRAAPIPPTTPVSLAFAPPGSAPGRTVQLVVRNDSSETRDVTIAVMDDALRALAQRWLDYADPNGAQWLGGPLLHPRGTLDEASFEDWNDEGWRHLLAWPPIVLEVPGEAPVVLEQPSPIDTASAVVAPAPPPAARSGATLDKISVTGSRIRRVDMESTEAKAPDAGLRPHEEHTTGLESLARVRTHFADTALWLPNLRLAPGESRTIPLALPDNLTRWRAVGWSNNAGSGFAMAESTLEAGLPLEARLQAPVRLYPGDQSRLAVNVRQTADVAGAVTVALQASGVDPGVHDTHSLSLDAKGQGSVATTIAPAGIGTLEVVARADGAAGQDAVATSIEVASPMIAARKVQAGWVDGPLKLDLPPLPSGVADPELHVALMRGDNGLISQWTRDLRDYPHRCWEQILSRAVAAAIALERKDASWPEARSVVQEALDNAAVFQAENGGFRYFVSGNEANWSTPDSSVALTAYTVRAFSLLRALGYPVAADVESSARRYLEDIEPGPVTADGEQRSVGADAKLDRFAFAAAARSDVDSAQLDRLWSEWSRLALPAQVAVTGALARSHHPAAAEAMALVLAKAPAHGAARTLQLGTRLDEWMSSAQREQCALIELLGDYPALAPAGTRAALVAGLTDLYAGGPAAVDTQTGVYCLMAMRARNATRGGDTMVSIHAGGTSTTLRLAEEADHAEWQAPARDVARLDIAPKQGSDVPLSFVSELRYQEDARQARASAIGFSIDRRYEVLRDAKWVPTAGQRLHEGDWIRITLIVETSAPRRFVAVSDAVPGGLRPTDLQLSGIAGPALKRVSDTGSSAFETRKLDARTPRFYAEYLPPGRHELHYFALVGNSGDYLAAPATMELMYGTASTARTAAMRLSIEAPVK